MSEYLSRLFGLLRNRNFILSLALFLGFVVGQGSVWTEKIVIYILGFVMMLSTISVDGSLFRSPRNLIYPILTGIIMNYLILGGFIILLSRLVPLNQPIRNGFIILASVPPAVGVIPFTGFLDGDVEFTLIGCLSSYLAAFLFTPLFTYTFLNLSTGLQVQLFTTLFQLIIIPLILSRLLAYTGAASKIEPVRGTLTNWSFFLVVYTVVGLNRDVFLNNITSLLPAFLVTVTTTYILGTLIQWATKTLKIDPGKAVSMVLLGTSKNAGFAAGLALTLFTRQSAVPSTIQTISMITYIIYLDYKIKNTKNAK